ncbi:hypothetical protein GC169_07245 [bacterium]|nr:hypothetical protein [bacterium]
MFGWFARKPRKVNPPSPEARWFVTCEGDMLWVMDDQRNQQHLAKADLSGVIIETNDSGPWGADVWWVLAGPDGQPAMTFPKGASGEDAMLDYLMELPGFDYEKMIEAMGSTDNASFPVWRRR